ncbi:MAG: phenylacetate--CoA ligase family protein [Desulfobacteraceae bacterium]|nr:phenylacetate--CoA ligase family protein [Desulfobacteraceae bacterium]MBC2757251.1 phenylacetate--CoA ligase family protein [Desulfobacteraceae bacterium]
MKRNIRSPRKDLDRLRLNLLQKQILNIFENVPFYREVFNKLKIAPKDFKTMNDLRELPIIMKEDIRNNGKKFLNEKMNLEKCFHSFTSGSTGQPFMSFFDKRCWMRKKYLSKLRARFACGMRPGERVAIFESEPAEKLEILNRHHFLRNLFLKVTYFSLFDDMEAMLKRLIAFKPQNAYGPQSYFFHLARKIKKTNQSLPFLKRIYTSSEYGQSHVTQFIRNILHVEVYDIYGSTEFKEVAWECEHHQGYHINEDDVLCEILNGNTPANPGEIGDIVLTDLRNLAMPLIRYRIQDRGRMLAESCLCGRTFSRMLPVVGRASEYIRLPDGEKISPFHFTTSIEKFKGLLQYQLIQKSETDILIKVILDENTGNETCMNIKKTIKNITRGRMQIHVRKTDKILPEENGKFKVVKNMIQKKHSP